MGEDTRNLAKVKGKPAYKLIQDDIESIIKARDKNCQITKGIKK